jgi:hypothetical protein
MNRLAIFFFCSLFTFLAFCQTSLQAQECDCPGKRLDQFKGNHQAPLDWWFSTSVVREGRPDSQPLMCYSRTVYNFSDSPVVNVWWKIAGYARRMIPQHGKNSSCSLLPGELDPSPRPGPLYYGISSEHYDTTVRPPRDGWMQQAAAPSSTDMPLIRSTFDVNVGDSSAQLVIYSSASTEDRKFYELKYEMENHGNVAVLMVVNLPMVGSMDKDLPFLSGFLMPPESRKTFFSKTFEPIDVQRATVLVLDENKKGLAADVVGVYAPIGGKRFLSDENLFDQLR